MINFIYNWEYKDYKQCWSGTPYGILEALKRQCEVKNFAINYKLNMFDKLWGKFLYGNEFNIKSTNKGEKQINKLNVQDNSPCLVFLEYMTQKIEDTYSFQDCSVDFLVRLRLNEKELLRYSPLPNSINEKGISKRLELTQKFYKHCKGIFTMSKWLANDLIINSQENPEKVHWVGGGCNIDISKIDMSQKKRNRFLFVGKDWERKNGPLVVKAFQLLAEKYPNIELYIAGPNKIPSKLIRDNRIKFVGCISYEELIILYNLCDFFVMPSQFEAYGIVFAEALIFGLPCIGKDCFAMPEFIEDGVNGYLIRNNDLEELALKMEKLLQNRNIVEFVKSNSCIYQDIYSWDRVAERIIKVFREDGYDI